MLILGFNCLPVSGKRGIHTTPKKQAGKALVTALCGVVKLLKNKIMSELCKVQLHANQMLMLGG